MAVMNGMTMMLKSMGLDPEELQKNVEGFKVEVITMIQNVDNRLANIELQNSKIILNQTKMIAAMEAMYSNKIDKDSLQITC